MKEFQLMKSEIRKAEKLADKVTGVNGHRMTGWTMTGNTDDSIIRIECEICDGETMRDRIQEKITLYVTTFDRRKSYARKEF